MQATTHRVTIDFMLLDNINSSNLMLDPVCHMNGIGFLTQLRK